MINIILIIIILVLFVCLFLFKKQDYETFTTYLKTVNIEDFEKYTKGEKVNDIFSNEFLELINKDNHSINIPSDLINLYNLREYLKHINNFTNEIFIKLITPYKEGLSPKFGLFSSLEHKNALKTLYNNLDDLDLDKNIKVEINSFYKKELLIKKINDIVDFKTINFINCQNTIIDYFKKHYKNSKISNEFTFYKLKNNLIDLHTYSIEELELLEKFLVSLPEETCDIISLFIKTSDMKDSKIKELSKCRNNLKTYIKDKYEHYKLPYNKSQDVLKDNFKGYHKKELDFVKNLYKYIFTCNDVKKVEDHTKDLLDKRQRYTKILKESINSEKVNSKQIKNCLHDMKLFIESHYNHNNIPLDLSNYPLEKLNKYNIEELEKIYKIYSNIPDCSNIKNDVLINDIYKIYNYIILKNNNTYGCLYSIEAYFQNGFKKHLNISYKEFLDRKFLRKLSNKNLQELLRFVKNTPACLELTNKGKESIRKRTDNTLDKYYYKFDKNQIFNLQKPKKNKFKTTTSEDLTGYYPNFNYKIGEKDNILPLEKIIDTGEKLDHYYKNKKDYEPPMDNLKKCITDYFRQTDGEGTFNIFTPSIEIDADQLNNVDVNNIIKNLKIN